MLLDLELASRQTKLRVNIQDLAYYRSARLTCKATFCADIKLSFSLLLVIIRFRLGVQTVPHYSFVSIQARQSEAEAGNIIRESERQKLSVSRCVALQYIGASLLV